jgi:hypothetical protein
MVSRGSRPKWEVSFGHVRGCFFLANRQRKSNRRGGVAHQRRTVTTPVLSERCMVNGNESNPAIFWPVYFKCDTQALHVAVVTNIAALTITMGGDLNPYGINGLEVWQFKEEWRRLPLKEIEAIVARLQALKNLVADSILK